MKNLLLQRVSLMMLMTVPVVGNATKVFAHGIQVQYHHTQAIALQATDENGNPIQNAQVIIYGPNHSENPWITGTTNAQGEFSFTPDSNQVGNWEVTVRQGGHGDRIEIPTQVYGEPETTPQVQLTSINSSGYTSMQKIVMSLVSLWGFVGTALFFTSRKDVISNKQ